MAKFPVCFRPTLHSIFPMTKTSVAFCVREENSNIVSTRPPSVKFLPGPTLKGHVGDRVKIRVVNNLPTETTSIHWHGIKQKGTPWMDGVPGVTQCPILPGESFVYDFVLDAPGTLWWHSHSGMQKSSLFGMIIITGDEAIVEQHHNPDIELLLSDWYHASSAEQEAGLRQRLPNPFRWVGDAQTLTIAGRGQFNCSETEKKCDPAHPDAGPTIIDVKENSRYRLRLVGASALSNQNFGIDAHSMRVVEAETTPLRPFWTRYLDIGASNSFSALLYTMTRAELDRKAPGHNGLFWIQTNVRHRSSGARGLAVLRYPFAGNATVPTRPPPEDWPARDDVAWSIWTANKIRSLRRVKVPPADRRIVLLGTQNRHEDGSLVWAMNNISHVGQRTPIIQAVKFGVAADEKARWVEQQTIPTPFDYNQTLGDAGLSIMARKAPHVIRLRRGEVVEVVLQNTRALGGAPEIHPWHLHLHNFWTVGRGWEFSTWSEKDVANYDLTTAPSMNTAILHPQSWVAFRFVADNAGPALFHCHILAHLQMGMGLVFQIGDAADIPAPPVGMPRCGAAARY